MFQPSSNTYVNFYISLWSINIIHFVLLKMVCFVKSLQKLQSFIIIAIIQSLHKQLERKIAKFHGREDSILYPSCFDANAGLFEVLLTAEDAVLSDELNHASIIDGIRLCKAQKYRYKHRDMTGVSYMTFFIKIGGYLIFSTGL